MTIEPIGIFAIVVLLGIAVLFIRAFTRTGSNSRRGDTGGDSGAPVMATSGHHDSRGDADASDTGGFGGGGGDGGGGGGE